MTWFESWQALWNREGRLWPCRKSEVGWLGEHCEFISIPKMAQQACIQVMTDIHQSKKIKIIPI